MLPFVHITEEKLEAILEPFAHMRVCVVHGKSSYVTCGAKSLFEVVVSKLRIQLFEHEDFSVNPKWNEISPILVKLREFKPALFIAVGGGSVIDTAKLLKFFYSNNSSPIAYEERSIQSYLPLYVFPTTAGSGSEATHFAVCYCDGKKYSVTDPTMLPDRVFVDYRFTLNNPSYLTACSGLDALCHSIESFWAVKATSKSKQYAKKALSLLLPNLYKCIYNPDAAIRRKIAEGAYLSGKAINISTTTAPHAFSYKITSLLGVPHGHAVAISMPFFFRINTALTKDNCSDVGNFSQLYENICQLKGLINMSTSEFEAYITSMTKSLYVRKVPTIKQWQEIIRNPNPQRLKNNPVVIDKLPDITDFCW